jgi:hypothetical protein
MNRMAERWFAGLGEGFDESIQWDFKLKWVIKRTTPVPSFLQGYD